PGVIYEAEAAKNTMGGEVKPHSCGACSGGQKIGFIGGGQANSLAINNVNVAAGGPYQLQIDYLVKGTRSFFVSVNDGPGRELTVSGETWASPRSIIIDVTLKAGRNRIVFYNDNAFAPDLDRVVLR